MCTAPNKVFYWYDKGEKYTKFTFGEKVHHLEEYDDGKIRLGYDDKQSYHACRLITDYDLVPCGHCEECRLMRAGQRRDRMIMETMTNGTENAWFITLTYDDLHLPIETYIDGNGEYQDAHSINVAECQRFIKRLRFKFWQSNKSDLRYVLVGEYGDRNGRPHYHMICWNLKLKDLEIDMYTTQTGNIQYISKELENLWQNGRVRVSNVAAGSLGYVARYVQKKLYSEEAYWYAEHRLVPPFILQSKGIGKEYLLNHYTDLMEHGIKYVTLNGESVGIKPDRYLEKLLLKNNLTSQKVLDILKEKKKVFSEDRETLLQTQTDMKKAERLTKQNAILKERTKALQRSL